MGIGASFAVSLFWAKVVALLDEVRYSRLNINETRKGETDMSIQDRILDQLKTATQQADEAGHEIELDYFIDADGAECYWRPADGYRVELWWDDIPENPGYAYRITEIEEGMNGNMESGEV